MTKVTSEKLVELVRRSELAEPSVLDKALEAIQAEHGGSLPEDPVAMAKELQKHEVVTRWHCEKLLQGKYKGFFLGKHKLLGHIGSGGMSSVYLAEHVMMHTKRAIKVLPQSRLGKSSYLARFQQEAKAIASLNHPNIVRAYDIDNQGDTHYIVMEYVDGPDLQTMVKKNGPMAFDKVADYMAQAAHGLQHAHEVGLIHRDVKPANLLVNSQGRVKLLDLGLALFADDAQASLTIDHNDKVLGTADYLAPEQALNSHKVDPRADLYGLGCTMYFLLTGSAPFPEGSIAQRIAKHQSEMPREVRKLRPNCPGELEGICVKLLQKDPKFRYASAAQTAEVLENWLAKYKAEKAARPVTVGGSSLELGDENDASVTSGSKAGSMVDTVSNRGADTDAGRSTSGSTVGTLSASDSGVLVRIARKASISDTGSTINLEAEIARRGKSSDGTSSAHGAGTAFQNVAKGNVKTPSIARGPTAVRPAPAPAPLPEKGIPRILWIIGLVIMFILAILLGFFIATLTTDHPPTTTEVTFRNHDEFQIVCAPPTENGQKETVKKLQACDFALG
jgi:eukaryotic-like serine/threonine-protein kinase